MQATLPAKLQLADGSSFPGLAPSWQKDNYYGEVVFTTGMVGYAEALTDPSYTGQILVFTYPLIGNYGVSTASTWESSKIHAVGVIVSELSAHYSHHAAEQSFASWLQAQAIPLLTGVDTRTLTKHLREQGTSPGVLVCNPTQPIKFPSNDPEDWLKTVSIPTPEIYGEGEKLVILLDCGMKASILECLLQFPIRVKRVPYNYDFTQEDYDGFVISNGPGDPQYCKESIAIVQKAFARGKPIFGICLGAQLMALAAGGQTYKLSFGHRSHNQPCIETTTQRAYLTSQNHGYAIEEASLPAEWQVSFRNLNDQTVAGIAHKTLPFFAVQFHPEAAPGPLDTRQLFAQFYALLNL